MLAFFLSFIFNNWYTYNGDDMIKSDSRRIEKGDIFVALSGIKHDGHDFIDEAILNGASSVVVSHGNYSVNTILVDDTRDYLNNYLSTNYKEIISKMKIIGITGTNGKTTTAHFIYQSLNKLGIKCSMIGTLGFFLEEKVMNLNNTCPDVAVIYECLIKSYNSGYNYVVIEASSQGLEEDRLYGIKFDYAVFTNLTHDHLDYHKSMENYLNSKRKLFNNLKKDGISIINIDDVNSNYFLSDNCIKYGFNNSDFQILNYNYNSFSFKYLNNKYFISTNFFGKYNFYNMICCIIVLYKIGFNFDKILEVCKSLYLPKGRMEEYRFLDNRIIIDYAHTPDAISCVLSVINNYNNLYVVFGCTGNRDKEKRPIMTNLILKKCRKLIITSDDLYDEEFNDIVSDMTKNCLNHNYFVCSDRKKAIEMGIGLLNSNDVLLILGKGHEEYIKIKNRLIPFSDSEVVKEFIYFDMNCK